MSIRSLTLVLTVVLAVVAMPATASAEIDGDPATGQPPSGERTLEIGLQQAITRALEASPRLDELRAVRSARAADARRARSGRLPDVDLRARYTRFSDVPELTVNVPGIGEQTIFQNIPDDLALRVEFGIPLYTGGRIGAAVDAAEGGRRAASHDLAAARTDLVFETTAAYWDLVVSRRRSRVLEEAIAAFDAHVEDARNRRRFGLAARNEVLAVRVERDRAELDRIRAANAVRLAEANLARLLDLEPGARIVPVDRLQEPAAGLDVETQAEANAGPATGPPTRAEGDAGDGPDEATPPIEELVAAALENRPERAALRVRHEVARARVRVEKAGRLPTVHASGGYEVAHPNRRVLPLTPTFKDTWDLSVGLVFDLFDGDETDAAVARAEAEADAVRRRLQNLERRIRLEVTARALELETSRAAARVSARALSSARENLQVASDRYREGLIPSSELLDAENALLRAGLDRAEALMQVRLAGAALDRAVGRSFP